MLGMGQHHRVTDATEETEETEDLLPECGLQTSEKITNTVDMIVGLNEFILGYVA